MDPGTLKLASDLRLDKTSDPLRKVVTNIKTLEPWPAHMHLLLDGVRNLE